jgi:glutaredoxin
MRPTLSLFTPSARLTLFTRASCGLCDVAKSRIHEFQQKRRGITYSEIDIMGPGQQKWRDVYDFDVPVLHIDRGDKTTTDLDAARKLMHRFTVEEVEGAVDEVMGSS